MAELYKLPDGTLVRRGVAFTIKLPRTRVVPAVVGTDDDGNQYIAEPAKLIDTEIEQIIPANWLQIASAQQLEAFGIEPIEEEPDPDQRFFSSAPAGVRDGVLRKNIVDRDIAILRRWMIDETKRQADGLIAGYYPLAQQIEDTAFVQDTEVPDSADEKELRRIKRRRRWMHDVRAYMRSLIEDIEKLTNATDAKAWFDTPAEWPEWPEWPEKSDANGSTAPAVEAAQ